MGHLKEGVCETVSKNPLRHLQDIVVEGCRCIRGEVYVCICELGK